MGSSKYRSPQGKSGHAPSPPSPWFEASWGNPHGEGSPWSILASVPTVAPAVPILAAFSVLSMVPSLTMDEMLQYAFFFFFEFPMPALGP